MVVLAGDIVGKPSEDGRDRGHARPWSFALGDLR
jgi:hypothetical protein